MSEARRKPSGQVWVGMPRHEFNRLKDYLRDIADRLGLRDWTLDMSYEPLQSDDDGAACVKCLYGRKRVEVRVARDWAKMDGEDKRHYIVHELIHPHFDASHSLFENELKKLVGESMATALEAQHRQHIEFGVDAMADALAPLMPAYPAAKLRKLRRWKRKRKRS
jgi:hypothetical protein